MTLLKIIGASAALVMLAQPAAAQQSTMDHGAMDHSQMDHKGHDHAGMETPNLADETIAESATVIIAKVNGLVCDFCAQALKKVFKKEAAVESLNVDLDVGEVSIALNPGHTFADERVKKLIRKSGYSLVSMRREGPE